MSPSTFITLTVGPLLALMAGVRELPASEPSVVVPSYNQFSEQDEKKLGEALVREFDGKYQSLDNSVLNAYMASVTQRLARHSARADLSYDCKTLNLAEVNAFSLPGGHIYVTRGLLDFVQNESELAAAMAHEIGHLAERHTLNRFSLELRSKALWASIQRGLPDFDFERLRKAFESLGMPLVNMVAVRYDRANENEADLLGFYNLLRSGWNPAGQIRYLERIAASAEGSDLFTEIRSAHPDAGERSRMLSEELKVVTLPRSLDEDSLAFRGVKLGLSLLPKPVTGPR